jgi:probable HAF family extracellular repeat protein
MEIPRRSFAFRKEKPMLRQSGLLLIGLSFALGITWTALAQQSGFGTFTTIDVPGASSTGAFAIVRINPSGDIVGSYGSADGKTHGFLLSKGVYTSIDFPGAGVTSANGINSEGEIVGAYRDGNGRAHGFLLSEGTFTNIDFPGATFTAADGINPSGSIVGQ